MAYTKTIETKKAPAQQQAPAKAPPVKHFRSCGITATIWENTNKELQVFKSVTLERSYKDKEGNWQKTGTLRNQDLPKAILVLQKAFEFINTKQENSEAVEEDVE